MARRIRSPKPSVENGIGAPECRPAKIASSIILHGHWPSLAVTRKVLRLHCSGTGRRIRIFEGKVLAKPGRADSNTYPSQIQRSSVVERSAVNRLVVGSNPTAGAIRRAVRCTHSLLHGLAA